MNTILNLMVCFLLVAQLISSSYLLIHSNYKLSDCSYSINRMDLYQMKYENIADRLKRLATSPLPSSANSSSNGTAPSFRTNVANFTRRDNGGNESQGRSRHQQALKYSKVTMETDYSSDQQSNPAPKRNFLKEKLSPAGRQKRTIYDRSLEYASNLTQERSQDDRPTFTKREGEYEGAKGKSESTLKMQEILESFNSYKLNKEKFMANVKSYTHNRTETEPVCTYARQTYKTEQHASPQETRKLFNQIDNIWNEDQNQDKVPQFQRSRKPKYGLNELTDVLNETLQLQENTSENRLKDYSRGKLIKNTAKTQESVIVDKPPIRSILSPRGIRAPGRICKNNTREFTSFQREGI